MFRFLPVAEISETIKICQESKVANGIRGKIKAMFGMQLANNIGKEPFFGHAERKMLRPFISIACFL